jgi:glutathione S-transferase
MATKTGNVDHDLYPSATGAALKFAEAHTNASGQDAPFTLYGSWFCPFVQRVWITLHLKSIPHRYVEINPYHKAAEFLARNPRGLVPTLAVNDPQYAGTSSSVNGEAAAPASTKEKILYESTIVAEYLDTLFPTSQPLLPTDPYDRARTKIWLDWVSGKIVPAFYRFLQHTPEKSYSLDEARDEFVNHVKTLVKQMRPTGPWFAGRQIGMVDVAVIPWAERIFLLDHYKGGSGIGKEVEDGDKEVWERWRAWAEAVRGNESVKATMSDPEKYIEAYQRYAEDKTQSQVGQATRGGRSLP